MIKTIFKFLLILIATLFYFDLVQPLIYAFSFKYWEIASSGHGFWRYFCAWLSPITFSIALILFFGLLPYFIEWLLKDKAMLGIRFLLFMNVIFIIYLFLNNLIKYYDWFTRVYSLLLILHLFLISLLVIRKQTH